MIFLNSFGFLVTGEWRRLHDEELHALYSSPDIIRGGQVKKTEMGGTCSTCGGRERCVQGFSGET